MIKIKILNPIEMMGMLRKEKRKKSLYFMVQFIENIAYKLQVFDLCI